MILQGQIELATVCNSEFAMSSSKAEATRTLLLLAFAERHQNVPGFLGNDGVEVLQYQRFNLLAPLVLLVQIPSLKQQQHTALYNRRSVDKQPVKNYSDNKQSLHLEFEQSLSYIIFHTALTVRLI